MARIVRGQLALDTGDRLRDAGAKLLRLHEYSGEALESQLKSIDVSLAASLSHLDTIIRSCRAAKNSYPNYPALRSALSEAGEAVYEIRGRVETLREQIKQDWEDQGEIVFIAKALISIAQTLRLVSFVPPEGGKAQAQA